MIKVSVIVPCYNSSNYLSNSINSLCKQSFKDFEVIFIDDKSKDDTYNVLKKILADVTFPYKILANEINIGPGASRNKGILKAEGEFISFLDSDDSYSNNFLTTMYDEVSSNNFDVVMCDYNRIYNSGKIKPMYPTNMFFRNMAKKDFLAYSFDSLCCMLIRKTIFEQIKIPELFNAEDVAVIPVIISKAQKISYVKKNIYNYHYREGSLSNSQTINNNKINSIIFALNFIESNVSSEYINEIEFLGAKIVIYGAVLNAIKSNYTNSQILSIITKFNVKYPLWYKNKYISSLGNSKKIFLFFANYKKIDFLRLLSLAHNILFKLKLA